jgi:tripartite-type tricarboxylate transporter receptor subunit TctC
VSPGCFIRRMTCRPTLLVLAVVGLAPSAVQAQAPYPNRTIRIVSTLAAATVSDISLRFLGQELASRLRVPVVIENQPGTGGVAAARAVMSSQADGYTLALGGNNWALSIGLFKNLPFDPRTDLTPVVGISEFAYLFVTSRASAYHSLGQVIAAARAKPNSLTFGTSSAGTTNHLTALLFKSALGLDFVVVPYKGPTDLSVALMRNDIDVVVNAYGGLRQGIEQGQIRVLATTTAARLPQLPDVPTMQESGVADFDVSSWNALYAPVGTPAEVIHTIGKAVTDVLSEAGMQQRFRELGLQVKTAPADQIAQRMRLESDRWSRAIAESGIEKQ